jgi:hypothetical protein
MIFPVPVTLKRFLALEFVFTLGILPSINCYTLEASRHWAGLCRTSSAIVPFFERGCKDRAVIPSGKGLIENKSRLPGEKACSIYSGNILY